MYDFITSIFNVILLISRTLSQQRSSDASDFDEEKMDLRSQQVEVRRKAIIRFDSLIIWYLNEIAVSHKSIILYFKAWFILIIVSIKLILLWFCTSSSFKRSFFLKKNLTISLATGSLSCVWLSHVFQYNICSHGPIMMRGCVLFRICSHLSSDIKPND